MKKRLVSKIAIISLITFIGLGGPALAYRGWGSGDCPGGGPGGKHKGGGYGYSANLSDEDVEKLNSERQAFFKQTQDLRNEIRAKELALRAELAKKSPDAEKAAGIQKELSDLRAQFDQKRLEHQIRMKEINPNAGAGFCDGKGKRGGRGGHGRGPGFCQRY